MEIDFCIVCHNFQRRLGWTLSSLSQQIGEQPKLHVYIASLANNGNPTTEAVIAEHSKYLDIHHTIYTDKEQIAYRGLVRNDQITSSSSEWIFFADADHVFHPIFFCELMQQLSNSVARSYPGVFTTRNKTATTRDGANKFVETCGIYVKDAFEEANKIITSNKNYFHKYVAAGCMQFVRREMINKYCKGLYVNPRRTRDWHMFNRGQMARSDKQFRHSFPSRNCLVSLPLMIHLDHDRDKEIGYHTEAQR